MTKSDKTLKIYTKAEKKPSFINNDKLQGLYDSTDLELWHVLECCKMLKPLKGIDINGQQIEFWYKEFLSLGWTRKIFDKQFESVKRAVLYNRIDLENWLNTPIMYSENEFEREISRRINIIIQRGNFLKDKDYILTEDDKKAIELAVANECEIKYKSGFYEARENYAQERRRLFEEKFKKG
jgi:hypothetical protein